jgi:hypothetical protein
MPTLLQAEYSTALQLDPTVVPQLSNLGALLRNSTIVAAAATLLPDPLVPGALATSLEIANHSAVDGGLRMFWGGTLVLEYEGAPPMSEGGLARAVIPAPRPEFVGPTPEEGELLLTAVDCTFEIQARIPCSESPLIQSVFRVSQLLSKRRAHSFHLIPPCIQFCSGPLIQFVLAAS